MKIIIRDDDTSFFTHPKELEAVYGNLYGKVEIVLGVIPYVKGSSQKYVPEKFQNNENYPIDKNKELVKYLREKIQRNEIKIALHGITHEDIDRQPEFSGGRDLTGEVAEAKKFLAKTFETDIKWFIPPHNKMDRLGLESVVKNNLDIMNVPRFLTTRVLWDPKNWMPFVKVIKENLKTGLMPLEILDFGDHRELFCWALTPKTDLKMLNRAKEVANERDGLFCIATHYWETQEKIYSGNNTVKNVLYKLISKAKP